NLRRHSELAAQREKRGPDKRPESRGRQQKETFGQHLEFALVHDVDLLIGRLGADETRGQAQALAQTKRPRFFGDEGIRTALDEKIAEALGGDDAAESRGAFEQCNL